MQHNHHIHESTGEHYRREPVMTTYHVWRPWVIRALQYTVFAVLIGGGIGLGWLLVLKSMEVQHVPCP